MGFVRASGGKREEGEEGNHLAEGARSKNIFLFFCLHSLYFIFLHAFLGGGKKLKQKAVIATARAEEEKKKRALTYSFFSSFTCGKKETAPCARAKLLVVFRHI